jgi:pimeloyl-ACP methyl ester carboxylesterase
VSPRILVDPGRADRPIGTVVALHGFTRQPEHLGALAHSCVESGITCVRPALAPRWAPLVIASPILVQRTAERLASALAVLPAPVVLVGHSAGAAAACWIGATWMQADSAGRPALAGIVLVDGVDSLTGLIRRSIPSLDAIPMRAVLAPPNPCNRHGALSGYLATHRPGISEVIDGSGHGDIEGEERWVYTRACGNRSAPETRTRVIAKVTDLARLMLLDELTN